MNHFFSQLPNSTPSVKQEGYQQANLSTKCVTRFNKKPLSIKPIVTAITIGSVALGMTACSTVKIGKRDTAQAIIEQRNTALTGDRLSSDTQSRLLQAGLDADKCLQNMPMCLVQLKNASLTDDKGLYGAYSELYYAASTRHKAGINCETTTRDLSTEFAKQHAAKPVKDDPKTAPVTEKSDKVSCQMAYQDDLLQSARFAYIYLMFDNLPKSANKPSDNASATLNAADSWDITGNAIDPQQVFAAGSAIVDKPAKTNAITRAEVIDQNNPDTKPKPVKLQYPPNERDIEVQDLYYVAVDELGDELYEKSLEKTYKINSNELVVSVNNQPFTDKTKSVKLVSSYQINLAKLNSISRRDGFGLNYVAVMDDRYTTSIRNQLLNKQAIDLPLNERIHPLGHLPMTALLLPKGTDLESLLTTNQFSLNLYDSYQFNSVPLYNKDLSLSANFSASYGLWLNENALDPVSLLNLFSKNYQTSKPQLFMLEPYNLNKRVIIMLHGLGSSPATWIGLTNDIFNDAKLRDNYQVWQVFYPTNIPILENRYEIKTLLDAAFKHVDPGSQDAASHHAVLIGHSMGGVIGRMLVSNDNLTQPLDDLIKNYDRSSLYNRSYRQLSALSKDKALTSRLELQAMPQVDRAIFISSPFQGTSYADKWFTRSLRRIISLPKGFVNVVTANLQSLYNDHTFMDSPLAGLFLENGASQLSDKSFFVKLTQNVKMVDTVKVNLIIATDDRDLFDALSAQDSQVANTAQDTHTSGSGVNGNASVDSESQPNIETSHDMIPAKLPKANDNPATLSSNPVPPASTTVKLYTTSNLDKAEEKVQKNQQLLEQVSQGATERVSDGIVPYRSAHLEGVESEKILAGKHNVHTSPQAILELRRILHRHLAENGNPSDASSKTNDEQP